MAPWDTRHDKDEDAPAAPTKSGDDVLAEAKRAHDAGEALTDEHVRALEHPAEFAGKDVLLSDAEREAAEA